MPGKSGERVDGEHSQRANECPIASTCNATHEVSIRGVPPSLVTHAQNMAETEDAGHAEEALRRLSLYGNGSETQEGDTENSVSEDEDGASKRSKASQEHANGHLRRNNADKATRVVSIRSSAASVSELRCVPFLLSTSFTLQPTFQSSLVLLTV